MIRNYIGAYAFVTFRLGLLIAGPYSAMPFIFECIPVVVNEIYLLVTDHLAKKNGGEEK
jgi:hypothetical protein